MGKSFFPFYIGGPDYFCCKQRGDSRSIARFSLWAEPGGVKERKEHKSHGGNLGVGREACHMK